MSNTSVQTAVKFREETVKKDVWFEVRLSVCCLRKAEVQTVQF